MKRKIEKVPLLITKSENLEGLLTLEKANKYKIGIIESIDFKTFCAINSQTSNYDNDYVILTKTNSWINPYVEPFTYETITVTDKRIIRGASNSIKLVYTGNDMTLKKISLSELGQIFPDEKSLEEYKNLFEIFSKENMEAYYEIQRIKEESKTYKSKTVQNAPDSKRGMEIYESLIRKNERVDRTLTRMYEELEYTESATTPKKILTIKR